ncbi:aminotransferase class IV [Acidimicrobium ferrooxidans]|uniref:aminotransferase class IV n=1 Tax=Acidimicrobium ferrooxidans TaxID=53635 RepID=UPI0009FD1CC1
MAVAWIDGALVDEADARVPVFDHGLVVGDGVFETLVVVGGRAFAIRRHLERLARSAQGMGITLPDLDALRGAIEAVVSTNGYERAKVRVTYTAGDGELGSGRVGGPTRAIVAEAPIELEPATCAVAVAPWPRNERGVLAGIKTTSYAENVVGLAWARARGASEVLFGNLAGNLCEGSGSNVFVVRDGDVLTPPLDAGPLAGVTRALLIERFAVKETNIPLDDLFDERVSEVFVTSTLRFVQGVHRLDDREFEQAPGPVTARAQALLADLVASDIDP